MTPTPEPLTIRRLPGEEPYRFPDGHAECGFCQDYGFQEGFRAGQEVPSPDDEDVFLGNNMAPVGGDAPTLGAERAALADRSAAATELLDAVEAYLRAIKGTFVIFEPAEDRLRKAYNAVVQEANRG